MHTLRTIRWVHRGTNVNGQLEHRLGRSDGCRNRPIRRQRCHWLRRHKTSVVKVGLTASIAAAAMGGAMQGLAPCAHAAPAPEVEYVYDVMVRRHYNFPNNDAVSYGSGLWAKVSPGEG